MDEWLIIMMLMAPLVAAMATALRPAAGSGDRLAIVGGLFTAGLALANAWQVETRGVLTAIDGQLRIDAVSALLVAAIGVLGCSAVIASGPYLRHDLASGHLSSNVTARWYFPAIFLFLAAMLATVSVNNLGLLWVCLEATTLVSAALVAFYRSRASLEAAWKYLILCTVGITCALFGVMLIWYAAWQQNEHASLKWNTLMENRTSLDGDLMRLAFVFVLIGYGTKAGLAPLHTWLADAHSQAPSPVSGLLSGVLLGCALYGIVRVQALTDGASGSRFASHSLIAFGVFSVAIAAPFILVQRDLKRLFAYSSVEHLGLMTLAFGIGGPLGITAGLLHLINHAATKGLVFLMAGEIGQVYGNRRISAIRDTLRVAPLAGWLLLIGAFALAGMPPFGIFVSELLIFKAGFDGSWPEIAAVVIVLTVLAVIFGGLLSQMIRVSYGPDTGAALSSQLGPEPKRPHRQLVLAVAPLLLVMVWFGLHVPGVVQNLLDSAASTLDPVQQQTASTR